MFSPYNGCMALHPGDHHTTARAVLGFVIVVLALMVLLMFYQNQDTIVMEGNFQKFVLLVVFGFCLLLGLLYFASKPHVSKKKRK